MNIMACLEPYYLCTKLWFKHIYLTSIEKKVLTIYTHLSRFCFLGATKVLAPNVWANENSTVDTRSGISNSGP